MLERVEASVVRQAEESRLGQVLAASMPVDVAAAATEVSVAEAVVAVPPGLLESSLAEQLRSTSVRVSPASWRTVQASIYGQVLADSTSRRRYWPLAAAGAAAAAILLLVLLSEGTSKPPEIVFADLATMPNVDFAILRYGAR